MPDYGYGQPDVPGEPRSPAGRAAGASNSAAAAAAATAAARVHAAVAEQMSRCWPSPGLPLPPIFSGQKKQGLEDPHDRLRRQEGAAARAPQQRKWW